MSDNPVIASLASLQRRREKLARGVSKEMGAAAVGQAHQKIADALIAWIDDYKPESTNE